MKKKGFTLIELLAVIVILAVIALIVLPIILNVIKEAERGSFKDSAYGIIRAAEDYYLEQEVKGVSLKGQTIDLATNTLQYKGSKPTSGSITYNDKGQVQLYMWKDDLCVSKVFTSTDVTLEKNVTLEEFNVLSKPLASEIVDTGDYINYSPDVPKWPNTVPMPTNSFEFGGWTEETDKSTPVECEEYNGPQTTTGWRVLANISGAVKIVTAGIPECYYHSGEFGPSLEILRAQDGINSAKSKYNNATYAKLVKYLYTTDIPTAGGKDYFWYYEYAPKYSAVLRTGNRYWLTDQYGRYTLFYIDYGGARANAGGRKYGLRPLVVLKEESRIIGGTGTFEDPYQLGIYVKK